MTRAELKKMAPAYLLDASALHEKGRHDGSIYLCGYAVELHLKALICDLHGWEEYKITEAYKSFRTHDLETLLDLSGKKLQVNTYRLAEWSVVKGWDPEMRYNPGTAVETDSRQMIDATTKLIENI